MKISIFLSENFHFWWLNLGIFEYACFRNDYDLLSIKKTRLFKYIENFTSKNRKFSGKKL